MENDLIYSPEELRVAPAEPQQNVEKVSKREYELIQELIKLRQEKNTELQFESLEDYEVPPRTQFSMLQKPAVTIKKGTMTFNAAAIRMFEGTHTIDTNREGLNTILEKANNNEFDILLLNHVTLISRNANKTFDYVVKLSQMGKSVYGVADEIYSLDDMAKKLHLSIKRRKQYEKFGN